MFSIGSDKKVWWICEQGHEWPATISSRAGNQHCGCPYCASQKCLTGVNDLETLAPQLAKEWDYEKNAPLTPQMVCAQSNLIFGWICSICGHKWQASPAHRFRGRGCMLCGRQKTAQAHFKPIINLDTGIKYNSIKEAATILNINADSIGNCCRKKTKTAGGYHWQFVE